MSLACFVISVQTSQLVEFIPFVIIKQRLVEDSGADFVVSKRAESGMEMSRILCPDWLTNIVRHVPRRNSTITSSYHGVYL